MIKSQIFLRLLPALFFISYSGAAQSIPDQFEELNIQPRTITYTNSLPLNEEGGHLQGIQFHSTGGDSFVLSGSSSTYAYFLVVEENQVVELVELDQKPMKHAGGFQIADNFLSIGIEDNEEKTRSEVLVYEIADSEIKKDPRWKIKREGAIMRATAGTIGHVRQQDELLVVVGDWDARNLDFYRIDLAAPLTSFTVPYLSVATTDLDKVGWIDDYWYSYQNINLLQDHAGKLFLVGLGTDENGTNVGDLYEMRLQEGKCDLRKISSRRFQSDSSVSFRAGAGVHISEDGKLQIVACSNHVGKEALIQVWQ
jgi:hypothetical protein